MASCASSAMQARAHGPRPEWDKRRAAGLAGRRDTAPRGRPRLPRLNAEDRHPLERAFAPPRNDELERDALVQTQAPGQQKVPICKAKGALTYTGIPLTGADGTPLYATA